MQVPLTHLQIIYKSCRNLPIDWFLCMIAFATIGLIEDGRHTKQSSSKFAYSSYITQLFPSQKSVICDVRLQGFVN